MRRKISKTAIEILKKIRKEAKVPVTRVLKFYKSGQPFAFISPWKSDRSLEENKLALKQFILDLKNLGYGFSLVNGVWEGEEEPSVYIVNIDPVTALALGKKYNQYSIIWGKDGIHFFIKCEDGKIEGFGNEFKIYKEDSETPGYSEVRHGRKFYFNYVPSSEIKKDKKATGVLWKYKWYFNYFKNTLKNELGIDVNIIEDKSELAKKIVNALFTKVPSEGLSPISERFIALSLNDPEVADKVVEEVYISDPETGKELAKILAQNTIVSDYLTPEDYGELIGAEGLPDEIKEEIDRPIQESIIELFKGYGVTNKPVPGLGFAEEKFLEVTPEEYTKLKSEWEKELEEANKKVEEKTEEKEEPQSSWHESLEEFLPNEEEGS